MTYFVEVFKGRRLDCCGKQSWGLHFSYDMIQGSVEGR